MARMQHTGKRLRHPSKRSRVRGSNFPKEKGPALSSEWDPTFMSEIQLQGLLDRPKEDEQDEEAMDMTVISCIRIRMSKKYDIRALKVGLKVTPEMRGELTEFNKDFIGENSVFPTKNVAPRTLEQFRGNPYTLELLYQYTTSSKPKKLTTARATYYQSWHR